MRIEMRRTPSRWLGKLLLLAGSLAFALGGFEAAGRPAVREADSGMLESVPTALE